MLANLMFNSVDLWRPQIAQQSAQTITGYDLIYQCIPCSIQPADSKMDIPYEGRESTITHNVYTNQTQLTIQREDLLEDAFGNQYHVVAAPKNALMLNIYYELAVEQYPEDHKKRLNKEAYE